MNVSSFPAMIAKQQAVLEAPAFFKAKNIEQLFILADSFIVKAVLLDEVLGRFEAEKIKVTLYSDFAGEPKLSKMEEIVALAKSQNCQAVMGIGGGSALDMAKILSITLAGTRPADDYWMMAHDLPEKSLPSIMLPTTAGTGSESCSTNIISDAHGHKGWVWGPQTKPDLILLDPDFSVSLPPHLSGWCGMDAIIHAFEASTNKYSHINAMSYGNQALKMAIEALPQVMKDGSDLTARTQMLLASTWAGAAIDQVGCAVAHHISHAMAGVGDVHHGRATAIGFEATLDWLCDDTLPEDGVVKFNRLARHIGLSDYHDLPSFFSDFMDQCQIERSLPPQFKAFDRNKMTEQLMADHTQSMRLATQKDVSDEVIAMIVDRLSGMPIHSDY